MYNPNSNIINIIKKEITAQIDNEDKLKIGKNHEELNNSVINKFKIQFILKINNRDKLEKIKNHEHIDEFMQHIEKTRTYFNKSLGNIIFIFNELSGTALWLPHREQKEQDYILLLEALKNKGNEQYNAIREEFLTLTYEYCNELKNLWKLFESQGKYQNYNNYVEFNKAAKQYQNHPAYKILYNEFSTDPEIKFAIEGIEEHTNHLEAHISNINNAQDHSTLNSAMCGMVSRNEGCPTEVTPITDSTTTKKITISATSHINLTDLF